MVIRSARPADAEDIAQLSSQLGYAVAGTGLIERLTRILSRPDQQLFVADVGGRPAGWLHAIVWECVEAEALVVIAGLVVDSTHRRRGIASMLMAEAEMWAKQQGCSVVRLWSSAGRTGSHRFYERLGYSNIKTQYSFAKPLDAAAEQNLHSLVPQIEQ